MKKMASKNNAASVSVGKESDLPKLGGPAERALAGTGVQRLEQLTRFSENEIKQLHGVEPNALAKLRQALAVQGLAFAEKRK
jgi:hypothetical protein